MPSSPPILPRQLTSKKNSAFRLGLCLCIHIHICKTNKSITKSVYFQRQKKGVLKLHYILGVLRKVTAQPFLGVFEKELEKKSFQRLWNQQCHEYMYTKTIRVNQVRYCRKVLWSQIVTWIWIQTNVYTLYRYGCRYRDRELWNPSLTLRDINKPFTPASIRQVPPPCQHVLYQTVDEQYLPCLHCWNSRVLLENFIAYACTE